MSTLEAEGARFRATVEELDAATDAVAALAAEIVEGDERAKTLARRAAQSVPAGEKNHSYTPAPHGLDDLGFDEAFRARAEEVLRRALSVARDPTKVPSASQVG